MININGIIENRIRMRDNKNKRALFEYEIKRIDKMNKEIIEFCEHDIVLYYGKKEEQRFECFSCGVKTSCYDHLNISDEVYIDKMRKQGKIVIDVSTYLEIVKKEVLFRIIETELANMLNKHKIDCGNLEVEIENKIKELKKSKN